MSFAAPKLAQLHSRVVKASVKRRLLDVSSPGIRLGRFRLLRVLGAGATSIVFEAHDCAYDLRIALKCIAHMDVTALTHLKREFRSVAELAHPNLATMHELLRLGDFWAISMELVDGTPFVEHVRTQPPGIHGFEHDHLMWALRQLADGVSAIHQHGLLHRDLKPSNVLVTREGHVVILDFGLACPTEKGDTGRLGRSGTPPYMAPELSTGGRPSEASDWFAVGVMLFEALYGHHPSSAPRDMSSRALAESATLESLLRELLHAQPERRYRAARRLTEFSDADHYARRSRDRAALPFFGRTRQRDCVRRAWERCRRGEGQFWLIPGEPGSGKSALLRKLRSELQIGGGLVLFGRCNYREAMPLRAFDQPLDELRRWVREQTQMERHAERSAALRGVADALQALYSGRGQGSEAIDGDASQALLNVLRGVCALCPMALLLDDLQWADDPSLRVIERLMSELARSHIMLIAAYRPDDVPDGTWLYHAHPPTGDAPQPHILPLGALELPESRALVSARLPEYDASLHAALIAESGGTPFLVELLIDYVQQTGAGPLCLNSALARQREQLAARSRKIVELLATEGTAVGVPAVLARCGLTHNDLDSVVQLGVERLVRVIRHDDDRLSVELYHPRLRSGLTTVERPTADSANGAAAASCVDAPILLANTDDFGVAQTRRHVLLHWRRRVRVEGVEAAAEAFTRLRRSDAPFGFCTLLEPECELRTSRALRSATAKLLHEHQDRLAASVVVYERDGLAAITVRGVITAIYLASGISSPNAVFSDRVRAVRWLASAVQPQEAGAPRDLLESIDALTRAWRGLRS